MDDLDGAARKIASVVERQRGKPGPGTVFQDVDDGQTHPRARRGRGRGFHPKFFSQNAPPYLLEKWAKNEALFNLALAMHMPSLQIDGVAVASGGAPEGVTGDEPARSTT